MTARARARVAAGTPARAAVLCLAAAVLAGCGGGGGGGSSGASRSTSTSVVAADEPLTPALASAQTVATGRFYGIEREGEGTVVLYRLADGTHALRFEDFVLSAVGAPGEVRLSPLATPRTTAEVAQAPTATVATLRAAAGSMNYPVPSSVDVAAYHSVVIWDAVRRSASVAATLRPAS